MTLAKDPFSGVRLCSRYSRIPNSLGYCGPSNSQNQFFDCILNGNCSNAKEALKKFEGLYPYLQLISSKHGKNPFDYDVVEAYWLGNNLLEGFSKKEFSMHLDLLATKGLPKSISEGLKPRIPANPIPMHAFNVLFVGVGNITGSVKPNLENMEKCLITTGTVKEISNDSITVKYKPLKNKEGKFFFSEQSEKKIAYDKNITPCTEGDIVSIHWENACEILTPERKKKLEEYTEEVLRLV